MKRVLFIVSSARRIGSRARVAGYAFAEVAIPYAVLTEYGVAVDFATPAGGTPTLTDLDQDDAAQAAFLLSDGFRRLNRSPRVADIDLAAYDAVFVPGGLGPMVDLVDDAATQHAIRTLWERGAIVSAICHGPAALLNVRLSDGTLLINGKAIAAFTNDEEVHYGAGDVAFSLQDELVARGAIHRAGPLFAEQLVVDGRLISGQNPASSAAVAHAIARSISAAIAA